MLHKNQGPYERNQGPYQTSSTPPTAAAASVVDSQYDCSALPLIVRTDDIHEATALMAKCLRYIDNWQVKGWVETAVREAVERGQVEMVRALFSIGANRLINIDILLPNSIFAFDHKVHLLVYALWKRNVPLADVILSYDDNKNIPSMLYNFQQAYVDRHSKIENDQENYEWVIRQLLDKGIGIDFIPEKQYQFGLSFLRFMRNVVGLNFIGVSVGGKPVTHDMLRASKAEGADEAIVTLAELERLPDAARKETLKQKINHAIAAQGGTINQNGVVNLVPLPIAAAIGDLETVQARLAAGVNPNTVNGYPTSAIPICSAARNGHEDIVDILLQCNNLDPTTLTAAYRAANEYGHEQVAVRLFSALDVNLADNKGNTPLHYAVDDGDVNKVRELLKRKANPNVRGNLGRPLMRYDLGFPLMIAINKIFHDRYTDDTTITRGKKTNPNYLEIIRLLLEHGANPDISEFGYTALESAGKSGCVEAFRLLLPVAKKEPIISNGQYGICGAGVQFPWYIHILHAYNNYTSTTSAWLDLWNILKDEGADFNQQYMHGGQLLHTVIRNFPNGFDYQKGVNSPIDTQRFQWGRSREDLVAERARDLENAKVADQQLFTESMQLLNFLLNNRVDPNSKHIEDKETALHYFIGHTDLSHIPGAYEQVIDLFISKGFNINTPNKAGDTLLHIAAAASNDSAVNYLLARGANKEACNHKGCTPQLEKNVHSNGGPKLR